MSTWATIILFLHVLGACVIVGVVFFSLVFALKKPADIANIRQYKFIHSFGKWAVAWQFVTGIILFFNEESDFKTSHVFWIKMAILLIDGVVAERLVQAKLKQVEAANKIEEAAHRTLVVYSWLSLLLIVIVLSLGFVLTNL